MAILNVSAIIVTRGDVDLVPILDSLPVEWERLVWDNGEPTGFHYRDGNDWRPDGFPGDVTDLSVYGRYAAIEYASHDLIYVQDDDCVVSDPQALVNEWLRGANFNTGTPVIGEPQFSTAVAGRDVLVANMPQPFRHDFYFDHCLVGFGAVFQRNLPERAFERFNAGLTMPGVCPPHWSGLVLFDNFNFRRTCDIVFTALTPRVLVDVPYRNLPWAEDETRMYRSENHVAERTRMLDLVRQVRDQ